MLVVLSQEWNIWDVCAIIGLNFTLPKQLPPLRSRESEKQNWNVPKLYNTAKNVRDPAELLDVNEQVSFEC